MQMTNAKTLGSQSWTTSRKRVAGQLLIALAAILATPRFASAQLVIDDFSTGNYQKTLEKGVDNNFQSGSMVGGSRETTFVACSTASACKTTNPFGQPSSFQIRPKTKSSPISLVFNSGYKAQSSLAVGYGFSAPMTLDLSSSYDRIRVYFDGADQVVNFNLTVWSTAGTLYSDIGCNLADPGLLTPFSVDFPFADFSPGHGTPGANFADITNMQFLFDGAQGAFAGEDWAVTLFEAVPIGAPPADITCTGFGS
jgi:hypothetical protein